jgi:ubiquinol oxidase
MEKVAPFRQAADANLHHKVAGMSDGIAFGFTKVLRFCADTFFARRYGHRAIVLETVAAVPGMVGATLTHLRCLRRMSDDKGWIRTLMEEAENERMHLMTFVSIAKPTLFERWVILGVQWVFYLAFFALYLVSARTAHRVVGYFEEEAVISYTHYLQELDEGRSPNVPAPAIARHYWKLPDDATLRDVILVVRADEAHHRDVNHAFANELSGLAVDRRPIAPYPEHAVDLAMPDRSTPVLDEKQEVGRRRLFVGTSGGGPS